MTSLILLSEWQKSQIEFWRKIEGFEGYDVSSFGRVRSWWTRARGRRGYEIGNSTSILKFGAHHQGYQVAYLYRKDIYRAQFFVHRLVAQAFIPNPDEKPQVNHLCGIKSDNRKDALEWSTPIDDHAHATRIGLRKNEKRPSYRPANTKLSNDQVLEIRHRRASGESCEALRKEYGVSNQSISEIVRGEKVKDVGGPLTTKASLYLLSDDNVRAIRIQASLGGKSFACLAREYGVNPSEISIAVHRKRRYSKII